MCESGLVDDLFGAQMHHWLAQTVIQTQMHCRLQQNLEIYADPKWQQSSSEIDADPKRQAQHSTGGWACQVGHMEDDCQIGRPEGEVLTHQSGLTEKLSKIRYTVDWCKILDAPWTTTKSRNRCWSQMATTQSRERCWSQETSTQPKR